MGSKVATRLPSTGVKVAKMANHMEVGDTFDKYDTRDTLLNGAVWRGGGCGVVARRKQGDHDDHRGGKVITRLPSTGGKVIKMLM